MMARNPAGPWEGKERQRLERIEADEGEAGEKKAGFQPALNEHLQRPELAGTNAAPGKSTANRTITAALESSSCS